VSPKLKDIRCCTRWTKQPPQLIWALARMRRGNRKGKGGVDRVSIYSVRREGKEGGEKGMDQRFDLTQDVSSRRLMEEGKRMGFFRVRGRKEKRGSGMRAPGDTAAFLTVSVLTIFWEGGGKGKEKRSRDVDGFLIRGRVGEKKEKRPASRVCQGWNKYPEASWRSSPR